MKCESACCCDGPNAAIDGAGVMDVGWVAGEQEPALAGYMVQHELKDLLRRCSTMGRGDFEDHCKRHEQPFRWRDANSEAMVIHNEQCYPWEAIIAQGMCKHVTPREEALRLLPKEAVKDFAVQLEEEVSGDLLHVDWH